MRAMCRLTAGFAILAAACTNSVRAQNSATYAVTYVEVMPNAAAEAAALLAPYRDASRKQDGNLRVDVLQEIARPNRFVIVEAWKDRAALEAHANSAETAKIRDGLKAIEDAPYDERIDNGLYLGEGISEQGAGEIFVVTHVDVIPPGKDECMAALNEMSIETPKDPGNIGYYVLQQANRSNHFTVVEEWTDMSAAANHAAAAHTRAFRKKLIPIAGALYDERLYKALN